MDNKLAREFHTGSLIRFALPNIVMMVFMSLYTIVDGIFISRFIGSNALSSLNIVFPVIFLRWFRHFEDDTCSHRIASLYIGVVETLDMSRQFGEMKRVLYLF